MTRVKGSSGASCVVSAMGTKLIKLAHDGKATLWSKVGPPLKRVKSHPNVTDKILVQEERTSTFENALEEQFYETPARTTFSHPPIYLYVLKDVWVTGSEGHIFFEPNVCFGACPSIKGIEPRKIRRPIRVFARVVREPVFILASRAPGNRGHFLTEHVPRLVASLDFLRRLGRFKVLVTPGHRTWQVAYLERLGIAPKDVVEASVGSVFCERAYFLPVLGEGPLATISIEDHYRTIREKFLQGENPGEKGDPVFLSRKDAPDRRLINEDAAFEIAASFFPGLRRVALSGLCLDDQIMLFQQAPVVIGPHSQAFRNILFCAGAVGIQLVQGFRRPDNEYAHWATNYNCLGLMFGNRCLPLFSGVAFYKNADWRYPEGKLESDLRRLKALLEAPEMAS